MLSKISQSITGKEGRKENMAALKRAASIMSSSTTSSGRKKKSIPAAISLQFWKPNIQRWPGEDGYFISGNLILFHKKSEKKRKKLKKKKTVFF